MWDGNHWLLARDRYMSTGQLALMLYYRVTGTDRWLYVTDMTVNVGVSPDMDFDLDTYVPSGRTAEWFAAHGLGTLSLTNVECQDDDSWESPIRRLILTREELSHIPTLRDRDDLPVPGLCKEHPSLLDLAF